MTVAISKAFYAIVWISTAPGHHARCESFPKKLLRLRERWPSIRWNICYNNHGQQRGSEASEKFTDFSLTQAQPSG